MSDFQPQPIPVQVVMPQVAPSKALPPKSVGIAYILLVLLGVLGIHQFYIGKIGRGVGYLFTCGWLFVGVVMDLFTLASQVRTINTHRALGLER